MGQILTQLRRASERCIEGGCVIVHDGNQTAAFHPSAPAYSSIHLSPLPSHPTGMDYVGGAVAGFLGITDSKFSYVLDHMSEEDLAAAQTDLRAR